MKAIVLDEHTLGIPREMGNGFFKLEILRASVQKGSPHAVPGVYECSFDPSIDSWRPATKQDFQVFNVMWNPSYTN